MLKAGIQWRNKSLCFLCWKSEGTKLTKSDTNFVLSGWWSWDFIRFYCFFSIPFPKKDFYLWKRFGLKLQWFFFMLWNIDGQETQKLLIVQTNFLKFKARQIYSSSLFHNFRSTFFCVFDHSSNERNFFSPCVRTLSGPNGQNVVVDPLKL